MVKQSGKYPIYRKYTNNRSYFKIENEKQFIEIQIMGTKFFPHEVTAKILPDFQLIKDMETLHNGHWVESTEDEFEEISTKSKT